MTMIILILAFIALLLPEIESLLILFVGQKSMSEPNITGNVIAHLFCPKHGEIPITEDTMKLLPVAKQFRCPHCGSIPTFISSKKKKKTIPSSN